MKAFVIIFTGMVALVAITGCGSSKEAEGHASWTAAWQGHSLNIDGYDDDWVKPLPYTDNNEKISYAVLNDRNNLYILLATASPLEEQKILQGGMSVWVNNEGDKDNTDAIGIGFPTDNRSNHERMLMAEARPDKFQKDRGLSLEDQKEYSLFGFSKSDPIQTFNYGGDNPAGVVVRMNYNRKGELIYEAAIPIRSIFPKISPTGFMGRQVAVGIFLDGLPPDMTPVQDGNGGGSGVSVGGAVGVGAGSYGSGGAVGLSIGIPIGRGGGGSGRQAFREAKIWKVVQLGGSHEPPEPPAKRPF
jgi:hypothetical protein